MNQKNFNSTVGVIFLIVAIVHASRLYWSLNVQFGATMIPQWASWVAVIVAGTLAYQGLKLGKK